MVYEIKMPFCQNFFLKLFGYREMHSNCCRGSFVLQNKRQRVESDNAKTSSPYNDHGYFVDHKYKQGHNTETHDNNNESDAENYMDASIDIHQTQQLYISNDYQTTCELDLVNAIQVFQI